MRKFITMLVFIGILNIAYCIDGVNLQTSTKFFFSQSELESKTASGWGNPSDFFLPCSNLDNQYYNIINNTQIISQSISPANDLHNGLLIEFNAVFLNVEKIDKGSRKHAKLTIDGYDYVFSAFVKDDVYGCVPQATSNKRDGKTSVKLAILHTNSKINMSFTPTDLGSTARLGISNLIVKAFTCGNNAEFSTTSEKCICRSGYVAKDIKVNKYTLTQCYKQ